jgi:alanyl-tRNA synthetase
MKADELREKYLEFFESKGHRRCPSDVLVPTWDPSVLFTPAGMNQFKPHFLGKVKLEFTRATTCQKCLRTGDIDNVGRTAYHHTFFEMLGNFSFGDYFKREAINWAWEFLTSQSWLAMDPDRLSVSVYLDDDEAARIWSTDVGLTDARIERMGEHDNFWPAGAPTEGPDGVCGPCSEIFFHDDQTGPVEIWNLVFTQFNRVGNPPHNLRPLPSKNIDTGMGLERTAAVLQGVDSNFHIDILRPIVLAAADTCSVRYQPDSENGRRLRRITDHIRACTFAIHENVNPGANKEKYVVRRLLRRAVLDGHQMGCREPFLHRIVPAVAQAMSGPYPELSQTIARVAGVIRQEEESFLATIDDGLQRIERIFAAMRQSGRRIVNGAEAAELYQTFGVPAELFEAICVERGFTFDWDGYRRAMAKHGEASGKQTHVVMGDTGPIDSLKKSVEETRFVGYETTTATAEIRGIVADDQLRQSLSADGEAETSLIVVLDQSPFYGESGGQVGDTGHLIGDDFELRVQDTQKDGGLLLHVCQLEKGTVHVGASVRSEVDATRREAIRRAHSATHVLHHALQKNLGAHAQQQGSKVDDDWLRFDFSNMSPVTSEQLDAIERDIHARMESDAPITARIVPLAEARAAGAMMLFGEKYPDPVRMISMGDFSKELCGGTHLERTGKILGFEIISEEGVAAGTRRVTALTGVKARDYLSQAENAVAQSAALLGCQVAEIAVATRQLTQQVRDLKKELAGGGKTREATENVKSSRTKSLSAAEVKALLRETARTLNVGLFDVPDRIQSLVAERNELMARITRLEKQEGASAANLLSQSQNVNGVTVVVSAIPVANPNLMRQLIDQIRKQSNSSAVLLAAAEGDAKVLLVAGVSRDLVDKGISAGEWVKVVAPVVGGGGGGKADMAQAGGKTPAQIPDALSKAREYIGSQLA